MCLHESSTARTLAPEDIRKSMFVAVASILDEWVLPASDCTGKDPRAVVARVRLLPSCDIEPLRVKSVCLPFVLVVTPAGTAKLLDVRQHELVALSEPFARKSFKALQPKPDKPAARTC